MKLNMKTNESKKGPMDNVANWGNKALREQSYRKACAEIGVNPVVNPQPMTAAEIAYGERIHRQTWAWHDAHQ